MRLTPINSAEAVFEPFFDEYLSEFSHWDTTTPGMPGLKFQQSWAMVIFEWDRPAADGLVLRMQRDYPELDCSRYDRLLACLNVPEGCTITLRAETDAGMRERTGAPVGATRREEWLDLAGAKRLRRLSIELHSPNAFAGHGWLLWLGFQHTARLPHHLAQWAQHDEQWTGYLQPADFQPTYRPSWGLLINAEELDAVRRDFADGELVRPLHDYAADAQGVIPERLIGQNFNFWNSNMFRRERDIGKMLSIHGVNAAQAGVLFQDPQLCRLAARYALSIAHCERWEDVFFAHTRGSVWDQRSFIQSIAAWDCAVILDLCGEWFTDLGRQLILRRIAEEAQGAMNHCSWWWEYLFHCNQLAWISPARIYGYLALEQTMPVRGEGYPVPQPSRVAPYTDIAWRELIESLEKTLLPDGGYVEGPGYFTWVVRQTVHSAQLYARARGRDLRELLPPALRRTDRLAEMLCSTDDRQDLILTADAGFAFGDALAYLAWLMPHSHWVTVFRKSLRRAGASPSLLALKLAREIPAAGPPLSPFCEMPDTGMMSSVRRLGSEYVKLFIAGNKAGSGHCHEDKGSFVLECAGDTFAADFGVTDYSNPIADLMCTAQRHTMLTPWCEEERPKPANPNPTQINPQGHGDETDFHATMDATPGWENWFRHWRRTWNSPTPDRFTLTDDWAVIRGQGVVFYWTTWLPMRREGRDVIIEGRRAVARLSFPPEVEIELEELPLRSAARRAIDEERREIMQFGLDYAETQPRLAARQRGTSGRLVVNVQLTLKS
ncbi:MAG: heparinase II/III family protein [Opitutaceae bacterium]|nr:heparinase II/III family protein [Opitutaceae bacterium]